MSSLVLPAPLSVFCPVNLHCSYIRAKTLAAEYDGDIASAQESVSDSSLGAWGLPRMAYVAFWCLAVKLENARYFLFWFRVISVSWRADCVPLPMDLTELGKHLAFWDFCWACSPPFHLFRIAIRWSPSSTWHALLHMDTALHTWLTRLWRECNVSWRDCSLRRVTVPKWWPLDWSRIRTWNVERASWQKVHEKTIECL